MGARGVFWAWAGSLLLVLAVYHPCLGFGFVADDLELVCRNPAVQSPRGRAWLAPYTEGMNGTWRPLRVTSYQIDAALFGPGNAAAYHAVNLLLHSMCGVLVFLLAFRWLGVKAPAALAAALFLVHPLQVESVAWITGRKELLSAALGLLALWLMDAAHPGPKPVARTLGAVVLMGACLAREGAVMLLPIAVVEGWLLGDAETRRRLGLRLVFPAVLAAAFALGYFFLSPRDAVHASWTGGVTGRLAAMLPLWGRALRLQVLPLGLRSHVEDLADPSLLGAALGFLVLGAAGLWVWRVGRRGRWLALAGALAYLPASNLLLGLRVPFAEHYLYLGLAFFTAGAGALAWRSWGRRAWFLVPLAMALSAARLPVWADEPAFWSRAHRDDPGTARLELNLATAYGNAGRLALCERHLLRALPRLQGPEERSDAAFNLELLRRKASLR